MTEIIKRLICKVFGHNWHRTVVQLPCGCSDKSFKCSSCGEEQRSPLYHWWSCCEHGLAIRELVAQRQRIELALSEIGCDGRGREKPPPPSCRHQGWEYRQHDRGGGFFYWCPKCELVIDCIPDVR
jgi:hypothetical protein